MLLFTCKSSPFILLNEHGHIGNTLISFGVNKKLPTMDGLQLISGLILLSSRA